MQMVKNIFITIIVFWFALLVFMPKQELYFTLEKELLKQDIEINEQNIEEGLFSLNLINPEIYVKGIKIATVEKINIFTLIFTTNINLKSLILDALINDEEIEVVALFTQPDKPVGRKKVMTSPPVKTLACENNIKIYQPNRLRDQVVVKELLDIEVVQRKKLKEISG